MYITSGMISAAEKKEGSDSKIIDFLHCKQVMAVGAMQMYISFGKKNFNIKLWWDIVTVTVIELTLCVFISDLVGVAELVNKVDGKKWAMISSLVPS